MLKAAGLAGQKHPAKCSLLILDVLVYNIMMQVHDICGAQRDARIEIKSILVVSSMCCTLAAYSELGLEVLSNHQPTNPVFR